MPIRKPPALTRLFNAFIAWPEPTAPVRSTEVPVARSTGITLSMIAGSPPTMIASSPVFARGTPPDTGASIMWQPSSIIRSASVCVIDGTPEHISITTVPGFMPAITASSPFASTRSTIVFVGSMVITTSDAAAS